ncbi:MAG: hypothetical protein JW850_15815 [Thermoflexales bacterium]|nr:hypothetical protein [Thermoflexales bacterium]
MDNTRITIALEQRERAALMQLARQELRDARDQVRHILRQELERRGLLPTEGTPSTPPAKPAGGVRA